MAIFLYLLNIIWDQGFRFGKNQLRKLNLKLLI